MKAIDRITKGHFVTLDNGDLCSITRTDDMIIGIAARDLAAGEIVDYREKQNTLDVITCGRVINGHPEGLSGEDDMEKLMEEIEITFADLRLDLPPELFIARCEEAVCRPRVVLDAIKEFSLRQNCDGNTLVAKWDTLMNYIVHIAAGRGSSDPGNDDTRSERERYIDNILSGFFSLSILEDDSSLNLIKIRLGGWR